MPPDVDLSDRELEILRLVATGASNKEIAQKLVISPNTVKVHLRNVFVKIGAVSRTEAAMFAMRAGLVDHFDPQVVAPEEIPAEPIPSNGADSSQPAQPTAKLEGALAGVQESLPLAEPAGFPYRRLLLGVGVLLLVVLAVLALRGPASSQKPLATATPLVSQFTSQRWQDELALPQPRSGMAAETYEGAIYVIAGETPAGVTGSTLRFNPSGSSWESLADKPTPVSDVQSALIGEEIYIPGGRGTDGQPTNQFEGYNLRLNTWQQLPALPVALSGYALAAVDGRLYLFGGWNGTRVVTSVYSFDPETNAWQERTPLASPRAYADAVPLEGHIFLIGGSDGSQPLSSILVYFPQRDLAGNQPYEDRTPMPQARSGIGATVVAGLIYVFGGEGPASPSGNLPPLQYQPATDKWTIFDPSPKAIGIRPALVTLETHLHVLGGISAAGPVALHQSYLAIYTITLPGVTK